MKKLRKYVIYLDDGYSCYKVAVPAQNEKEARKFVEGNGEIIAVKDITEEVPISLLKVSEALSNAGFGETEIELIQRTLQNTEIAE